MNWSVWRTGGKRHSYWHLVYRGSEDLARAHFEEIKGSLSRQKAGAVRLQDECDKKVDGYRAGVKA